MEFKVERYEALTGVKLTGLVLGILISLSVQRASAAIKAVSPQVVSEIEQNIQTIKEAGVKLDFTKVSNKSWNCHLYGMRSKIQVESIVALYFFSTQQGNKPEVGIVTNKGNHLFKNYQLTNNTLIAKKDSLEDIIYYEEGSNKLFGYLMQNKSNSKKISSSNENVKQIVAYTVCS